MAELIISDLTHRTRFSVLNKKKQGQVLIYFPDFWSPIRPESIVHNKDGAKRHHNFSHFNFLIILAHFSGLSGLVFTK
jgi:hypothetical protein